MGSVVPKQLTVICKGAGYLCSSILRFGADELQYYN